ncbi:MAG: succinate dehydrogenase [Myxococcota bacterium]|nr:succinate dehydrogenase [Myxococcota bacterium]MDW8362248.1 hypothetical protein [Myxococcales bacterium]
MSEAAGAPRRLRVFLETRRTDSWWAFQLFTLLVLTAFVAYATQRVFVDAHYEWGPYLSPFYSPVLFGDSRHALFGPKPEWWPSWAPFSPALLILAIPAGFRFTCYYYRGAYYKAFWADPPACAVGEPGLRGRRFRGEHRWPLILQNVHRYFLYLSVVVVGFLAYDVYLATQFEDGFGIGVGTVLFAVNIVLIAGYTFGCHSMRHLLGGRRDVLPKSAIGRACYQGCSRLNRRHMLFAWLSLFTVWSCDVYVRLLSMGVIRDIRIL